MINENIFYFGVVIIILIFIFFIYSTIKADEVPIDYEINLNEHKKLIILSIILLIGAIIVWRIVFLTIFYGSVAFYYKYTDTMLQIQKILNG